MNIVIVGAGDIGQYVATLLSKEQHDVILVDKDKQKLDEISRSVDVATRYGSGTDWQLMDDLLELFPDMLIALTNHDDTNLVVCSIAKQLGYPTTIARIRDNRFLNRTRLDFARLFDVDHFIGPELLVAHDILKYMTSERSMIVEHFAHGAVQLRTLVIPAHWRKQNQKLCDIIFPSGVMVGLIRRKEAKGDQIIFPHGNDRLMAGDEVTFIGETDVVSNLHREFGISTKEVESVTIIGGSLTGTHLARLLARRHIHTRIIEKDYHRCCKLAELLPEAAIKHHDATDIDFLQAEKIDLSDLVVACTHHDEVNILVGMLSVEIGCPDVLMMLTNTRYIPLIKKLGINHVVSPRISATNRLLSQIFTGTVTSLISLYENEAEVVEVDVSVDSKVVGIPLSDLGPLFPKDFLIAMIQNRGRIMVANGNRIVSPGDTVIVITHPRHIAELEKIF